MNFPQTYLLPILHVFIFIALLMNVGSSKDGYNERLEKPFISNLTRNGIIGLAFALISFFLFIFYIVYSQLDLEHTSLYLGYIVTALAYLIPFFSNCHNEFEENNKSINVCGWVAIMLGFLGLTTTIIHSFETGNSTEYSTDYMIMLSQFISVISAIIALSGKTIKEEIINKKKLSRHKKSVRIHKIDRLRMGSSDSYFYRIICISV